MQLRHTLLALPLLAVLACDGSIGGGKFEEGKPDEPGLGIVGGTADVNHPYVVGVGDNFGAFCTGTVISTRTVITAGHCFGGIRKIFLGPNVNGQTINVVQEIRHPGYSNSTLTNDLAILKLGQDFPFPPAPLLRETMSNTPTYIGPNFTFVGYGNSSSSGGFGLKRSVTFPIAAVGPANVGGTPGSIDSTMFYYRVPGENTCNGDSGGPAFIVRGGVERHAGVTSFGDGPCTFDGVNNRTDNPAITSFIQPHIDQFEPGNPCKNDGQCNASCGAFDPDCAANHCGADGECSYACAQPIDPDCTDVLNSSSRCNDEDGLCNPNCSGGDDDCQGLSTPVCGDEVVDPGEECDDGNNSNGDGCSANCQIEEPDQECGNGDLEPGEECDDGNNSNGDGCSSSCTLEGSQGSFVGSSSDTPISIPDNNSAGITSTIHVPAGIVANKVIIDILITHTYRGDLIVTLTAPNGQEAIITNRQGGSADNVSGSMELTSQFTLPMNAAGAWTLRVSDRARLDTGSLVSWTLRLNGDGSTTPPPSGGTFIGENNNSASIPDNNSTGRTSTINVSGVSNVTSVQVALDIDHTWRGDLEVTLTNPQGVTRTVIARTNPGDSTDDIVGVFNVTGFSGNGNGTWTLRVRDLARFDTGTLRSWGLALNTSF